MINMCECGESLEKLALISPRKQRLNRWVRVAHSCGCCWRSCSASGLGALAGGMAAGAAFIGGMDIAVSRYLALRLMTNCGVNRVKRRAAHHDERQITIPVPVVASALASLPATGEFECTTRQPALGGRDDPTVLGPHAYDFRATG
jgi:hypothetical protein